MKDDPFPGVGTVEMRRRIADARLGKRRLADIGKKIVDFADAKNVAGDARSRR